MRASPNCRRPCPTARSRSSRRLEGPPARIRDNQSHAASEGRGRGSDLAVTAGGRPRRWPGSPFGCRVASSARRRSRFPDRGRFGRFRGQLHRISHRPSRKLAHVSGKTAFVRFLPGVLGHPAGGRIHSHSPEKQGFSHARCGRLAVPCEAKRRVAAPDFAPLFRSGHLLVAGSASPRSVMSCRFTFRPRDNRSHAASDGRGRGSDLAVTAGELNAGAGAPLPNHFSFRRRPHFSLPSTRPCIMGQAPL